ncbi:BamA/TamA family outer membrane protein [Sulfurimonas sp.]|uniref:autotransporter assembly complex protein TamA n=1 Tax=Sulfurimonas sp. TaxID=2022749 RepID=UPI0025F87DE1|nr:BamA/TamA family outer membrane protein [Sulfurimonas sp.]MDD5157001.1 BamA/TamA family outer membrane protein [Sulfurimonas sp.]
MKRKLLIYFFLSSLLFGDKLPLLLEGNKKISSRELYKSINLEKPYFYEFGKEEPSINIKTVSLITQTLKDYYKTRGYFHAELSHSSNNKNITIQIKENEPTIIKDIAIISDIKLDGTLNITDGEVFDADKFAQSKKDITTMYANKGFCDIDLESKAWIDKEENRAYIVYEIKPKNICHFGKIEVVGSKNIDKNIVKSLLKIEENEQFSLNKIAQSYENLYANDGISKAIIDTTIHSEDNKVDAKVTITENEKPIRFQASIGASSNEGAMAKLSIKHRNFFGNLKTLSLNTRVTQIKQEITTNFDMPLNNKNSMGTEVGLSNEDFISFKEKSSFGSVYTRQLFSSNTFKESLVFDSSVSYASENIYEFPNKSLFVISPKLEWGYDVRDNIFDPTHGHYINAEIAGSVLSNISDASYYKYKIDGGYIMPVSSLILALKAGYGSMDVQEGSIPNSYHFFAGGMNSNRAYGYRKLGPVDSQNNAVGSNSIFETTAELRFKIYGNVGGVVFNDNTFLGDGTTPDYSIGYYSAGFGVRYKTPIGPLAIDFGFNVDNPRENYAVHFHIGELF